MHKVLNEFRIIETEDGFLIEIKGDKERLRSYVMSIRPPSFSESDDFPSLRSSRRSQSPFREPRRPPQSGNPLRRRSSPFGRPSPLDDDDDSPSPFFSSRARRSGHRLALCALLHG